MTKIDETLSGIFSRVRASLLADDLRFVLMYGPWMAMHSDLYANEIKAIASTQDTYGVILGIFMAVKKIIDIGTEHKDKKSTAKAKICDAIHSFSKQYRNQGAINILVNLLKDIDMYAAENAMMSYQPIVAYGVGLEKSRIPSNYDGLEMSKSLLDPIMMRFLSLEVADKSIKERLPEIAFDMLSAVPIQILNHTELTYDIDSDSPFLSDANPLLRATLDMGTTDVFVQAYYFIAAALYLNIQDDVLRRFFRTYGWVDNALSDENGFMKKVLEVATYTHVTESTELPENNPYILGTDEPRDDRDFTQYYDKITAYIFSHREVFCTQRANQELLNAVPNLMDNYTILQDDILIAKTADSSEHEMYVCPFEDLANGNAVRFLVLYTDADTIAIRDEIE